jgi:NhaP-type Na+/H+ and K+/H+ antiporter
MFLQNRPPAIPRLIPGLRRSIVFLIYSLTQLVGGSGILALYISGIIVGNIAFLYRRHLMRFIDSLAWIMQISMFLILGLLVNPHELGAIAPAGIACTLILIFIARPLAVFICLFRSRFNISEQALISWSGLKGAFRLFWLPIHCLKKSLSPNIFNLISSCLSFQSLPGKNFAYLDTRLSFGSKP